MPTARTATPLSARTVPLPRSATASPIVPRFSSRGHISVGSDEAYDEAPTSLPLPSLSLNDVTMGTDISTENETGLNPEGQSQSEREPTFSSEEGLTQSSRGGNDSTLRHNNNSPASLASAFSSPIPSASTMMTPTPAFQSRPRARFNLQPMQVQASTTPPDPPNEDFHEDVSEHTNDSTWHADQQQNYGDAVPATPASNAHKRSFLLSVINSTARPRLKYPTPHPHRVDVSEAPVPETPGVNMQTALAGATPRPRVPVRPRLSHPLAQGWTAKSDSGSGSESASRAQSPGGYDGAVDRASFISTASSQDLTTNVRANASFDPVMGLGDRGHGVGRFNAGKLNNYLHGLNRKLQEENESLMAQLRAYEEKHGSGLSSVSAVDIQTAEDSVQHARRRSSVGRRVSAGPLGLGDVAEDMEEEKAAMEEMLEEFKEELEKVSVEKEEVEKEREGIQRVLEEERAERLRDKERWRERMSEVEKGVQNIVEDLDRKLQEAEQRVQLAEREKIQTVKEVERRLAEVVVERDILAERMEKAEGALESGRDLGGEVNAANERVGKVLGDLKNANIQINDLEDQVVHADERVDSLEHELQDEKKLVSELEEELQLKSEELSQTLQRIGMLEGDLNSAHDELDGYKANAAQLEEDAGAALEHIESLEQQLAVAQERLEAVTEVLDQERDNTGRLEGEAARASSLAKRMEEALEAAEKNMLSDEEQVANLRTKVAALERELDRSRSRIEPSQIGMDAEAEAQIESLEAELEDAHKEIARLNALVSQSPARKAVENAKNAKIEILEQERDDLLDRLKSAKTNSIMLSTPGRRASSSGLSPMHRQILSLSMKSPRTPGGPLRDVSCFFEAIIQVLPLSAALMASNYYA
ncbi:hypothetical protein PHLCEN_2v7462 [Hermanssonia centrifuga]|uniref:Uncharacterized protein n=1 Tax=Hermanssonia centrifuga TaxID=98765 RepID=A0A2R6NWF7_9APHY|nr:hypothetical protein PHLCEN_2v7462 [Hermanssonia centrifuga]